MSGTHDDLRNNSAARSSSSGTTKKAAGPVNGLADNIIEVHRGRYLLSDSDGKNDIVLNEEELCFILDNTVVQDTPSSDTSTRASSASSSSHSRPGSTPGKRKSSNSDHDDRSNSHYEQRKSDSGLNFTPSGNSRGSFARSRGASDYGRGSSDRSRGASDYSRGSSDRSRGASDRYGSASDRSMSPDRSTGGFNRRHDTSGRRSADSDRQAMEGAGRRKTTSSQQKLFRKNPLSPTEQLLALHTTEVLQESSSRDASPSPQDCSICLSSIEEESSYQSEQDTSRDLVGCVALKLCGHHFHTSCLKQMASHDSSCLTCPNCLTIHGVRIGTQPEGGRMLINVSNTSLPGFSGCKTLQITYSFNGGTQGPEHPNPGRPYHLVGFPRIAFLPDNEKGRKALNLLQVAFNRRLIFTVGTSSTTGSTDCVVWNGIHHKTETQNFGGHGYPDPKYLDNVMLELANFGIV